MEMADVYTPLQKESKEDSESAIITWSQKLKIYLGSIISFLATIVILIAFFTTGNLYIINKLVVMFSIGVCGMILDFGEAYYIQIIATVLGVVLSISETVTAGITVNAFIRIKKLEDKLHLKVMFCDFITGPLMDLCFVYKDVYRMILLIN